MQAQRGFTFSELLSSLAVAGILLGVALPGMVSIVRDSLVTEHTNSLIQSLNLARSTAIRLGRKATVCASDDGSTCSGHDWSQGWIVWLDRDGNGKMRSQERIDTYTGLPQSATITETRDNAALTYRPDGASNAATRPAFQVALTDCTNGAARSVTLSPSGRPKTREIACP